jgi:predicted nucleotidyltransferase component of viral defense system
MFINVNWITMKESSRRVIQDLEILQLLILDEIFAQPLSRNLLFQGGTCLRWVYNGTRYSEDLDFLAMDIKARDIRALRITLEKGLQKKLAVQFGPGHLKMSAGAKSRAPLHAFWVKYRREGERSKMAVKVEIQEALWADAERMVLRQLPEVSRFLLEAVIRVPFGRSVLQCSPVQEILAEKIKALAERPYFKGRDLYDIWFMKSVLQVSTTPDLVIERTKAYPGKFVSKRSLSSFLNAPTRKKVIAALKELQRFVPQDELEMMKDKNYHHILLAVESTIRELLEKGLHERIIR